MRYYMNEKRDNDDNLIAYEDWDDCMVALIERAWNGMIGWRGEMTWSASRMPSGLYYQIVCDVDLPVPDGYRFQDIGDDLYTKVPVFKSQCLSKRFLGCIAEDVEIVKKGGSK
jgi:hypothetical protein